MSSEAVLSESEKTYILHSVEANFRCDGRKRNELRPVVLETGVVSHASGSAHLRLANTDILVGVKAELEAPLPGALNQGRLEFFVDCSGLFLCLSPFSIHSLLILSSVSLCSSTANATPAFEGRGGEALATSISRLLARSYSSTEALDLSKYLLKSSEDQ